MKKRNAWRVLVGALAALLLVLGVSVVAGAAGAGADAAWADEASNTNTDNASLGSSSSDDQDDERKGALLDLGEDNLIDTQQLPDSSFIYDTSIADLSTADSYLDGRTVQVSGEVIGDRIQAEMDSTHSWLVLTDTQDLKRQTAASNTSNEEGQKAASTISVYVPTEYANLVDTYGRYQQIGTTLQVRGTFNLVCSEHQGLTDIHVTYATVLQKGKVSQAVFDVQQFIPGVVLVLVGALMLLVYNILRERMR